MSTPRTLQSVVDEYCKCNARLRSQYSVRLINMAVGRFAKYLGREAMLADLTDANLAEFMRKRGCDVAPATVEREAGKLMAVWRWAAMQGMVKPPTVTVCHVSPGVPVAWSRDEIKRLLKAADRADGACGNIPNKLLFPAMLRLAWETGERIGAIRQARWQDIDLTRRWVKFRGETRKGHGAADNQQRISRRLVKALRALHAIHKHERPFGHVHLTTLYFHLKRIHIAAGLPTDRHSMLHRLRRSHATHLYVAGGDPTTSLGHSSDYITRKRYLDPRFIRRTFGADLLQGWFARMIGKVRTALGGTP